MRIANCELRICEFAKKAEEPCRHSGLSGIGTRETRDGGTERAPGMRGFSSSPHPGISSSRHFGISESDPGRASLARMTGLVWSMERGRTLSSFRLVRNRNEGDTGRGNGASPGHAGRFLISSSRHFGISASRHFGIGSWTRFACQDDGDQSNGWIRRSGGKP